MKKKTFILLVYTCVSFFGEEPLTSLCPPTCVCTFSSSPFHVCLSSYSMCFSMIITGLHTDVYSHLGV